MKLNYKRTILVGFAFFLITAFWQAYDAIVPLILTNHFGLLQSVSGAVMSLDNVIAVFMLPIFGALSDKMNTRYGKRTPFVVIGTVAAIILFIILAVVDGVQLSSVMESSISESYAKAAALRDDAYEMIKSGKTGGDSALVESGNALLAQAEEMLESVRVETYAITKANILPLIGFIVCLLLLLIAMATFRSPAVALMPDITVKPLRSKGNAVINLMGTAGGIIVLVLGIIFATSKIYKSYMGYVIAVAAVMAIGLAVFILTVKEKKWADEMIEDTKRLGLEEVHEKKDESAPSRGLTKGERRSFIFILASVALWYVGYNSITSKYSVYATNILGFDYNLTLIIAQVAAIIAYIPVGVLASKIGRKKSILAGVIMLTAAFFAGNFIDSSISEFVMYPIFVIAGIGWATINVNSLPMVVELASGSDVGKYTGYYYTASMAAQIIAPIFSGILYDIFSMRVAFFAFGTVFAALSFVTMLFVKHGDSIPEAKPAYENISEVD